MSVKKDEEERKMTVACPLCLKRGKHSKVKLFQINYSEALVSCEDSQCPFPLLEGHLTDIVRRDFRNMKDEVPAKESVPVSDNSDSGSEKSSQNKSANIIEEAESSKVDTQPVKSTTTETDAVINNSASNSEVIVDKFEEFEFTPPASEQTESKKKRKKYYSGCRKRKSMRKPAPKPQSVGIETES